MKYITQEELDDIKTVSVCLQNTRHVIEDLCKEERADITYGFELGGVTSALLHMQNELEEVFNQIKYREQDKN